MSLALKALMVMSIAVGAILILFSFYWRMADPGGQEIGIEPYPGILGIILMGLGIFGLMLFGRRKRP